MPAVRNAHRPILGSRQFVWGDEAACAACARVLAARPALAHACVELHGPLGAGKTTFVRHLLRALGVGGRIKSPTWAVLESYRVPGREGAFEVSHFDFYRFDDAREWADAGFRDIYAEPGLKLAEWPEKAAAVLPAADLRVCIEPGDGDIRNVTFEAGTPLGLQLL